MRQLHSVILFSSFFSLASGILFTLTDDFHVFNCVAGNKIQHESETDADVENIKARFELFVFRFGLNFSGLNQRRL